MPRPSRDGDGASAAAETRVLFIGEDLRIAEFVSAGLELDGHEVVVAEDGEVGVFLANTEPFDLIVLDLAFSGVSGLEILSRIRGAVGGTPVVVLSERDDPSARHESQAAGASAFIAKPLVVESLRARVREHLARRSS
jgi:DNA-binding response OmpR family regulator